ncbi:PTS transporter subunit EIIA [Rhodobacterales bacterium HKCCE2091]|nr:PTS transporter subunit EIIA [Rhodobacterales bacterium HKCCE2091]
MELSTLLKPDAVRVVADVTSKKRLMQKIAEVAEGIVGLPASSVFEALQDRESLGPTGVGGGVALPHARLPGLTEVHGAFLRLEHPIDFDSVDRLPVDLVFALFAPADSGVDHLKALALVSRTLRNEALCNKLRANSDPATLHTLITEGEASRAA